MTEETCLANARIVLEDREIAGQLIISGTHIARIAETSAVPRGAIDLEGDYLIPGLIELHTDNLEQHLEPRPEVSWPHEAALIAHDAELASCGITTVFDALRIGSISSGKGRDRRYARQLASELIALREGGALRIGHFIHLRAEICSETLLEELAEFTPQDRIGLISLMDHTPGQRQFRDINKLREYMQGKRGLSDDEFQSHIAMLTALHDRNGARHEAAVVETAHRLEVLLASHDDTTATQVAVSAGHGVRLAEFPTTLEAATACRQAGIAVMMGAPNIVRGGSHSGNVSASELAECDLLDILSSDYVPAALLLGAFRLAGIWDDLPRAIGTVTSAPARAAGLHDRGILAEGKRADLARVATYNGNPIVRAGWYQGKRIV